MAVEPSIFLVVTVLWILQYILSYCLYQAPIDTLFANQHMICWFANKPSVYGVDTNDNMSIRMDFFGQVTSSALNISLSEPSAFFSDAIWHHFATNVGEVVDYWMVGLDLLKMLRKQVFPQVVVKNANEATMAGSNKITLLKQIQVGVFFSFFYPS